MPTTAFLGTTWGAIGTSVATAAATAVVGAAVSSALTKKPEQQVQPINMNEKPPALQEAKSPELIAKKNALAASAGADVGQSSTLLTGANGIAPASLSLGRNTLLGS